LGGGHETGIAHGRRRAPSARLGTLARTRSIIRPGASVGQDGEGRREGSECHATMRSMRSLTPTALASRIDHTVLKPDASAEDVRRLCAEARGYGFGAVCVNPVRIRLAADELRDSSISICSVIGFPFGTSVPAAKAFEARHAIADGATEIDMMINLGALRDCKEEIVRQDIAVVREATGPHVLKVIIEAAILSEEEIATVSTMAIEAGADFVKTSTGFHAGGGARAEHVRVIRQTIGDRGQIKAAGGIRDLNAALAMIEAGADRLGASASVDIVTALRQESSAGGK
jgi:deoxyribose-phosphate aldolase